MELPENLTKIGMMAFSGCSALDTIRIPGQVTEIELFAFSGCRSLRSVIMEPRSVPAIGNGVFEYCNLKAEDIVTPPGMEEAYLTALGFGGNDDNQGGGNSGDQGGSGGAGDQDDGSGSGDGNDDNVYEEAMINQAALAGIIAENDITGLPNNGGVMPENVSSGKQENTGGTAANRSDAAAEGSKEQEPRTGDEASFALYATLAMITGMAYMLLYFMEYKRGMTEEKKSELLSGLIGWAKRGGRYRKPIALAAIFVITVYYHSIGRRTDEKCRVEEG